MLDVDHFKRVNDTYGHATGDVMLRMLADICQRSARDIDLLGRLGGEEFLLILPETPLSGAIHLAERLQQTVEQAHIASDNGNAVGVTVSIGVAAYGGVGVTHLQNLIDRADAALYRAKALGRNQVVVASVSDLPETHDRFDTDADPNSVGPTTRTHDSVEPTLLDGPNAPVDIPLLLAA